MTTRVSVSSVSRVFRSLSLRNIVRAVVRRSLLQHIRIRHASMASYVSSFIVETKRAYLTCLSSVIFPQVEQPRYVPYSG